MDRKKIIRRTARGLAIAVATPVVLFLVLAIAIYIPPVQDFIVRKTTARLSESTGLDIRIDRVRLAFPLDLAVSRLRATDQGDTLVAARAMRLNVALRPLFKGRADIGGFGLYDAVVDTKSYLPDVRVKGRLGELSAASHGVEWAAEHVRLDYVRLVGADLSVALSDTAQQDTTPSTAAWVVDVVRADLQRTALRLSMPGDSMRVAASLTEAALRDGHFDTGRGNYSLRRLLVRQGQVTYDTGRFAVPVEQLPALPFTAENNAGTIRTAPFDPAHIALTDLGVIIDTLSYDAAGTLRMGVRRVAFAERCGLRVNGLSGSVYMDSARLALPALNLRTAYSRLDAGVELPWRALSEGRGGEMLLRLDAAIDHRDIATLARGFVADDILAALPARPLTLIAEVSGNMDRLDIRSLKAAMPGVVSLTASGHAVHPMDDSRSGTVRFDLRGGDLRPVMALLPTDVRQTVALPRGMAASGTADFAADRYKADARLSAAGGSLSLRASADTRRETYSLRTAARRFPLQAFLPHMGLGAFTGRLDASGAGFDPMRPSARLHTEADVTQFDYDGINLGGIRLDATLHRGKAEAAFSADNEAVQASGTLAATLGRTIDAVLDADIPVVDLTRLGVLKDSLQIGTHLTVHANADRAFTAYGVEGALSDNRFLTPQKSIPAKDLEFSFHAAPDNTDAAISAGDLRLQLASTETIGRISSHAADFAALAEKQLAQRSIDQNALKETLPVLRFMLDAGQDNPLAAIARLKGYTFSSAYLNLNTAPASGIDGTVRIGAMKTGALLLDTIHASLHQDSTGVKLAGTVHNFTKKNPNKFTVDLDAYLLAAGAGAEFTFRDANGEKGVEIGVRAEVQDSGLHVCLYPEHPVIAYRGFTVNRDNYIFLSNAGLVSADIDLLADDGTGLKIYGHPQDSANDLTASVNHVNLAELSTVMPYLPRLSGSLSGDVHVTDRGGILSAMANFEAAGFKYEDTDLGDVGVEAIYLPTAADEHHASAYISYNGEEVLECEGTYFDRDGGSFEGEAQLHDFPLLMLNGFMAGTDVAFRGRAGGDFSVRGTLDRPVMDGQMLFDSAHVYSDVYGFDFRLDERPVQIAGSRMSFERFALYSTGTNPLLLDGSLDMTDLSRIGLDFTMQARDYELINTKRKKSSLIFGKVYANYDGTLRGTADNIFVNGRLEVLDRTDMTYILKDSPLSVDDRLHDLVQFVSFTDTAEVEAKPVATGGFDLTLGVTVSDAARFHCNLSEDGESYVDLEGGGNLTLRMTQQGDMRLTGRFTTESGEMKYALPVIPLKTFTLVPGSYVEFTGDAANPTLSIAAKETVKATVTENDQPRTVAFDVGVALSKPLESMGLEFTIEAPEDLSVQNELTAMSQEQRSKAAVTMLATGMYLTDDSKMSGGGFKANNALNAFLQSEIQNIAGNALRSIDVNFGVESGTSDAGTSTTDYSFQFAKRFWGNRISVIVGGKVSTGADATNSAASIIDNVSVEYRLDQSATRYVNVFYDRNSQDPLEGQLTKTGAGLILRRKTNRLGELFIFRSPKTQ